MADGLVTAAQLAQQDPRYPLELAFCPHCSLVQILETVSPEVLFCQDYPYFSSFSDSWLAHSRRNALELIDRCRLSAHSFVVEIASNDGYLLKNFVQQGIPVLGIDPAAGPVRAAKQAGVPTLCTFFTEKLAEQIARDGQHADLILANNVLAHVADTNGFVRGIRKLLKPQGMIVIEVPYLRDLVEKCEFDTVYHQHLCYFSVTAVQHLFQQHALFLNDVRRLPTHGGSLRLYFGHAQRPTESVQQLLREEQQLGLDRLDYFAGFSQRVERIGLELYTLLTQLKREGKTVAGYGAAAKACTLLNFVGLDSELIQYVVDRNVHKHGKYMPGVRIPIFPPERLRDEMPDYVVLLAWNLAEEIIAQQHEYIARGGRFIVPIPELQIIPSPAAE